MEYVQNRCKIAFYCSATCQARDWSRGHNKECQSRTVGQTTKGELGKSRYRGLCNPDVLCCLNVTVQSLFHIFEFRKLILGLKGTSTPQAKCRVTTALQQAFRYLQDDSDQLFTCKGLLTVLVNRCSALDEDLSVQRDPNELRSVLFTCLQEEMEQLPQVEPSAALRRLCRCDTQCFLMMGSEETVTMKDSSWFLPMSLGGNQRNNYTLEGVLKHYVSEIRDGEVVSKTDIVSLPDVLHLHLSRCYIEEGRVVKSCARLEYPLRLDFDCLASGGKAYILHTVVVHDGETAESGHYWAYIRPFLEQWYEFNDADVTSCTERTAMDDQCRAQVTMLTYIREDRAAQILGLTPQDDVSVAPITHAGAVAAALRVETTNALMSNETLVDEASSLSKRAKQNS